MELTPPRSLETEHEALHPQLVPLTHLPGKVGDAARLVATRLHERFALEEECAVPPLGLLAPLARGGATPAKRSILAKTNRLKAGLPRTESSTAAWSTLPGSGLGGDARRGSPCRRTHQPRRGAGRRPSRGEPTTSPWRGPGRLMARGHS